MKNGYNEQGGLVIIQTSALHSLFEYVNAHIALLSGPASSSRSNIREFPEVSALQKSYNVDGPSSSLKTTGRSVSLPPWATTKKPAQMRRLVSAPRRMQVATELMPEVVPKKGFDGNLSADLVGLSLVLVQRGTSIMGKCVYFCSYLVSSVKSFGFRSAFPGVDL